MIGAIAAKKALGFAKEHRVALIIAGLSLMCLLLAYCMGQKGEVTRQQTRTIKTQQQVGKANESAAAARVDDAIRGEQQKVELSHAIENATSPDDLRRRRGCAILRQQGRDVSAIPACR